MEATRTRNVLVLHNNSVTVQYLEKMESKMLRCGFHASLVAKLFNVDVLVNYPV